MDLGRTWAIARKEFIHIRRDPYSLIMIMLLPVIQLLIYGYALTFNIKDVPVAVYNRDQGHLADKYLNGFRGSPYFKLTRAVDSNKSLDRLIVDRRVRLGLVFPHDFTRLLHQGRSAPIQALVDGAEPNAAHVILGYVQSISSDFNQKMLGDRLNRYGLQRLSTRLKPEWRFWFNEDLESINFVVPGLIVVIMTMVGALLTALTIVREVERGSMESLLATPLLLVLLVVEWSDLVFAIDSIPAVFAVTRDPFIVYSSNLFAILGLRAVFFVLAGALDRFHYIKPGVALILIFVGAKMISSAWLHPSKVLSLVVIVTILAGSVILSLLRPRAAT